MSNYVGRLTVTRNQDPPRRLMEDAINDVLEDRGEEGFATIEFLRLEGDEDSISPPSVAIYAEAAAVEGEAVGRSVEERRFARALAERLRGLSRRLDAG